MIPTMIAIGLTLGMAARRLGLPPTAAIALGTSVGWGLLVDEVLGGTLLGLANLSVGLVIGLGAVLLFQPASRRPVA